MSHYGSVIIIIIINVPQARGSGGVGVMFGVRNSGSSIMGMGNGLLVAN